MTSEEFRNDSLFLRDQLQSNGSQIWVETRNGIIREGGVNNPPKTWDPNTGFNSPVKPGGKNYAYII